MEYSYIKSATYSNASPSGRTEQNNQECSGASSKKKVLEHNTQCEELSTKEVIPRYGKNFTSHRDKIRSQIARQNRVILRQFSSSIIDTDQPTASRVPFLLPPPCSCYRPSCFSSGSAPHTLRTGGVKPSTPVAHGKARWSTSKTWSVVYPVYFNSKKTVAAGEACPDS
jgi:hypothetical protein